MTIDLQTAIDLLDVQPAREVAFTSRDGTRRDEDGASIDARQAEPWVWALGPFGSWPVRLDEAVAKLQAHTDLATEACLRLMVLRRSVARGEWHLGPTDLAGPVSALNWADLSIEAGRQSYQLALDVLSARQLVCLEPERGVRDWRLPALAPDNAIVLPLAGDQIGAVRDFIDQLRGGPRGEFKDIATMAFGTKRYDRWPRERCDVRFGCAPRHGDINMEVYLRDEWRKQVDRLPAHRVDAAVRVLEAMLDGRLPSDTLAGEAP